MPNADKKFSLGVRTLTGAGWVIVWRMSTRLIGIVNTIVLVRILVPADFGLVALATTFSQVIELLSSIGVAEAIVREHETDRALYDTGFTLNLLRGLAMGLLVAACAWPVATFFNDARLLNIQFVLAGTLLLAALENIGVVEFRRGLNFAKEFQLALLPRLVSVMVSIAVAILFRNYWALIAGIVTNRVLRVAMSYRIHPFRPSISLHAWRRLIGFSFWTWMSTLVAVTRDRIDTLVIGRFLGPIKTGIYAVGYEIGSLASTELVEPLTIALFAGFSAGKRAGTDVADGYFRAISATFLLTMPLGIGLAIFARPVVSLLFGPAWLDAVPLVQVFALVGMLKVIAYFSGVLLNAHAMISTTFRVLLVALAVRVPLLVALIGRFGLMGAAASAAGGILVEEALFMIICFRRFHLNPMDLVRGTWRCILATSAMAAALLWLGFGATPVIENKSAVIYEMLGGVPLGAMIYACVLLAAWFAAGRPGGAERVFLTIFGDVTRQALARWRA